MFRVPDYSHTSSSPSPSSSPSTSSAHYASASIASLSKRNVWQNSVLDSVILTREAELRPPGFATQRPSPSPSAARGILKKNGGFSADGQRQHTALSSSTSSLYGGGGGGGGSSTFSLTEAGGSGLLSASASGPLRPMPMQQTALPHLQRALSASMTLGPNVSVLSSASAHSAQGASAYSPGVGGRRRRRARSSWQRSRRKTPGGGRGRGRPATTTTTFRSGGVGFEVSLREASALSKDPSMEPTRERIGACWRMLEEFGDMLGAAQQEQFGFIVDELRRAIFSTR